MNSVFHGVYPKSWSYSKICVIFEKGDYMETNNYRGICITNSLPKLYDSILNDRFMTWYTSLDEQAGAQAGRGCAEQLLTLWLLIDIARTDKLVLYVM